MKYAIAVLDHHRRDLLATANAAELKMAEMLDPHTETTIDQIRMHRLHAEELQRSIAILNANADVVSIEDVR